jgi:hypothetical protein
MGVGVGESGGGGGRVGLPAAAALLPGLIAGGGAAGVTIPGEGERAWW